MPDYGVFAATRSRRVPPAYVIRASPAGVHERMARKLEEHAIRMDVLTAPARVRVEEFAIDRLIRAERPFQGHLDVSLSGRFEQREIELPAGSIVVRTDQPLGRVVFYLLEPESDDSLTTWNVFDAALEPGGVHPVLKVMPGQRLETRPRP
jgi:hypothetical protein